MKKGFLFGKIYFLFYDEFQKLQQQKKFVRNEK